MLQQPPFDVENTAKTPPKPSSSRPFSAFRESQRLALVRSVAIHPQSALLTPVSLAFPPNYVMAALYLL